MISSNEDRFFQSQFKPQFQFVDHLKTLSLSECITEGGNTIYWKMYIPIVQPVQARSVRV